MQSQPPPTATKANKLVFSYVSFLFINRWQRNKKSGIFTSVTDIFPTFEGKKEWKGYHKGGLDNSGKPASAFNAFKR
ncbi:hypothetical protein HMPREF2532_00767 [Bacteroides ovatus]|uniref:Uncharacterized protein n=1 Tax=Bacteroides xylanisolvens TaxID=371601 RepID=A0A412K2J2_9BACE|nr:hypothetical protein HMPREF2532_00767 [Bacteroides ovatus]RGJ04230.1 hypothetical protein DXD80_01595 [Bacteroides xylanisolvens]RGS61429.1 hypothetical protein DWX88_03370 [Bacteroides xylanisolvens]RHK22947.1 hypothetical protein DW075_17360 [Bacteroides xylanisolvens]RJU61021.1 hypothetical protein DW862_17055 [Bacteroides sp. AM37-9]